MDRVDATDLERFARELLTRAGVPTEVARQVAIQDGSETVAPAGSGGPIHSTDPVAFGVPTLQALDFPIVLDTATSQVAHGKVRGSRPTTSRSPRSGRQRTRVTRRATLGPSNGCRGALPSRRTRGRLQGFGLAVVTELFAAILGDGTVAGQQNLDRSQNVAAIYAADSTQFTKRDAVADRPPF